MAASYFWGLGTRSRYRSRVCTRMKLTSNSLVLIFTLKGIVLILYQRIFFERWQKWVLCITTALCVSGFVGLTLAFSLRCLPYTQRWQVSPPPSIMCTASPKVLIATSCVNAVTDVFVCSPSDDEKSKYLMPCSCSVCLSRCYGTYRSRCERASYVSQSDGYLLNPTVVSQSSSSLRQECLSSQHGKLQDIPKTLLR